MTWRYGGCYKGKVYPFVPMEDYISPRGDKLYCDCKYAIIGELSTGESSVGFINRMRSLRWLFLKVRTPNAVTTPLITNSNLEVIQIDLHTERITANPLLIDLSASTKLQSIYIYSHDVDWRIRGAHLNL